MTINSQSETKDPQERAKKPIFSIEERREIVGSFCKGYLSGKLRIISWTPGRVVDMETGAKTSREELLQSKTNFLTQLFIACGVGNQTQAEVDVAVERIFMWLLGWRGSGLLEGEFLTIDQQSRIEALESRLGDLEKLMLQLIEEVRMLSHVKGSSGP